MRDMLANRYLLNGQAAKALGLYAEALEASPAQPDLRCRLILAHLVLERIEQAAELVLETLRSGGLEAVQALAAGCQGFVPREGEREPAAVAGIRALLHGDLPQARALLGSLEGEAPPALARLAKELREQPGEQQGEHHEP